MRWKQSCKFALLFAIAIAVASFCGVASASSTAPPPHREIGYSIQVDADFDPIAAIATDIETGISIPIAPESVPSEFMPRAPDSTLASIGIVDPLAGGGATVLQTPVFDAVSDAWTLVVTPSTSTTDDGEKLARRHFAAVDAALSEAKARAKSARIDYDSARKAHPYGT